MNEIDRLLDQIDLLRARINELETQCEHMAMDGLDMSMAMLRIQKVISEYQANKIPCHCSSCRDRRK